MGRAEPAITIVALNLVIDEQQPSWTAMTDHFVGLYGRLVKTLGIRGGRRQANQVIDVPATPVGVLHSIPKWVTRSTLSDGDCPTFSSGTYLVGRGGIVVGSHSARKRILNAGGSQKKNRDKSDRRDIAVS